MLELTERDNWQQIYGETKLTARIDRYPYYEPLQDFEVFCDATTIAVGCYNSNAYYNWQLGAWCYINLPGSPSSNVNLQDLY